MAKYVYELIGTFFLVFTVGMTVIGHKPDDGIIPAMAIGASLMVMVYASGFKSGGHLNPAVTLGVFLRGRCEIKDVAPYMIAQVAGAALAAVAAIYLRGDTGTAATPDVPKWLLVEFLGTFMLVWAVLNTATAKGNANNSFYGLAIGFSVVVMVFAAGDISGGAFNPAVAIGAVIMGLIKPAAVWIHIVAGLAAGAVAGLLFNALNPDDK